LSKQNPFAKLQLLLRTFYNGKVLLTKQPATATVAALALASTGDTTKIGLFLFIVVLS
jgi:hypothetical protein